MIKRSLIPLAMLFTGLAAAHATNLGFGQLGGNNTTVPVNFGSRATVDAPGLVVALGGATPNIELTWDYGRPSNGWDIHTSGFFSSLEDQFIGGGAWDNEGNVPRIGQLDFGDHTILFSVDDDYKLVLNSFDFGLTGETANTTTSWNLTLTALSTNIVVWSQSITFVVVGNTADTQVITPNFTGVSGEDYLLTFHRTFQSFPSDGRHGIDNLSFSQVPEPATYGVALASLLGALAVARRRKASKD